MSIRKKTRVNSKYDDLILIDWNNFLYKTIYGFDMNLRKIEGYTDSEHSIEGRETHFIKYIINRVIDIKKKFKSSKLVVCMDAPKDRYWRTRIYPLYKGNRKYGDDGVDYPMYFNLIKLHLNSINIVLNEIDDISITMVDKMEADDLIYFFTEKYNEKFMNIHILSNDGDLSQLEKYKNVHRYDKLYPHTKKIKSLDWEMYMMEKVIKGDDGDNIISIGSKWVFNPELVTFMINKVFEQSDKLVVAEEMIDKLNIVEKEDIVKFNKWVSDFKKSEPKNNKVRKKKNVMKFNKTDMDNFITNRLDLGKHIKTHHGNEAFRNFKLNNKLVTFTQIPKFLVKKCKPHISFESNVEIDISKKRMVKLVYSDILL